jgi:hypothetical protein
MPCRSASQFGALYAIHTWPASSFPGGDADWQVQSRALSAENQRGTNFRIAKNQQLGGSQGLSDVLSTCRVIDTREHCKAFRFYDVLQFIQSGDDRVLALDEHESLPLCAIRSGWECQ